MEKEEIGVKRGEKRVEKEEFGVESGEQESGERRLYIRVGRREWRVEKVWWRKEELKKEK